MSSNTFCWGLFASNFAFQDTVELLSGQTASYTNFAQHSVTKWQHHEYHPKGQPGEPGFAALRFDDASRSGSVSAYAFSETGTVSVAWTRFGVTDLSAVPAWRQSLYGAFSLAKDYPSAAIVLFASAFEAFFMETMRMQWEQSGRDMHGFNQLSGDNIRITSLVTWLPQIFDGPRFSGTPYANWHNLVNKQRNDVVHRARIDFTSEQAFASMKATIDAIVAIDPLALVRPHPYYSRPPKNADDSEQSSDSDDS